MRSTTRWLAPLALVLLAVAGPVGCGGGPERKPLDTETIRDHADEADRDLDRESSKHQE